VAAAADWACSYFIERDWAVKLDASVVIRTFAESKAGRKNFDK
jgi:hypothetical protein